MHADYWQRTEEQCESPRAEDQSLAFRSDQGRWLAPRTEERWVLLASGGGEIERRGRGGRPSRGRDRSPGAKCHRPKGRSR